MFDSIVVGAGPAGASAAYYLAKKGHSVLIIEKASLPRYKPCGGGVSPAIAEWFDFDFTPVVKNTISQVKYTWKMGEPMEIQLKDVTPMWMVQRGEFDNFLVRQAVERGAELKDNLEVTAINLQGDSWQVTTNGGNFEGKYLIAADGANGFVAKQLGFAPTKTVAAASLEVPGEISDRRANMAYFDFGSLKNGFMWCFPKTDGFSFSGAYVRDERGNLEELQEQLYKYAEQFGLNAASGKYIEHPLNLWDGDRSLHGERVVIAGEAAGIVDPLIGEGIRPAIFTGIEAATAVSKAIAGETDALAQYTENIKREWGSNLAKAQLLAGIFYKAPKIAYKVGLKRPATGQVMGKILCGELSYSEVAEKVTKKLRFIPGLG
jgi:geranylgeranyl reductase family protein